MEAWQAVVGLVGLLLAPGASSAAVGVSADQSEGGSTLHSCGNTVPHSPIIITEEKGPHGFILGHGPTGDPIYRPGSGVIDGNGTEENPYIIEGWCILPKSPPTDEESEQYIDPLRFDRQNVRIQGTDSHVLLRHNELPGHPTQLRVWINEADNVSMVDNEIFRAGGTGGSNAKDLFQSLPGRLRGAGVWVTESEDIAIKENLISNSGSYGEGVYIETATNYDIVANSISGNGGSGVFILSSEEGTITENIFKDNYHGIEIDESRQTLIANNRILENNLSGVFLYETRDIMILDNYISENRRSGILHDAGSLGTKISGNNIVENQQSGLAVEDSAKLSATENWWGSPSGPSGGVEDACTGGVADGEGDSIKVPWSDDVCFDPWLRSPNPGAGIGG